MNERRDDMVERALALLRDDAALESPDPRLEAELRRRHRARRGGLRRFLWPGLVVVSLSGVATAGGWELVRRWWFSVEVDGRRVEGEIDGDGTRTLHLTTQDGDDATVRVERETNEDGERRTRIELDRTGAAGVEQQVAESVVAPAADDRARLPVDRLGTRAPLFGAGDEADPIAVYLLEGALESEPALLVLHHEKTAPDELIVWTALPAGAPSDGSRLTFVEHPDGALEALLRRPDGGEVAFELTRHLHGRVDAPELQSDDGRIRVRVDEPER